MTSSLIAKNQFVGLENVSHLAAGGETPMFKSHMEVVAQFMEDKGRGELARDLEAAKLDQAREKCARLFSVNADEITFLSNATEGINNVVFGLDWKPGDNIVVVDVEFPSGLLPWTQLKQQGVEVRIVSHTNWFIDLNDIAALIDEKTRVVEISHVSMFTGQRIDLRALSKIVRDSNALLLLDATHSAGVIPVEAKLADIMVSSCYKWMMGVHGAAVFYVNSERVPHFQPPFIGWNNPQKHGGWKDPLQYDLKKSAHRFQPGNAGFISVYILDNALDYLLELGIDQIESHALCLSKSIISAIDELGFELMTPRNDLQRAGNVSFMADNLVNIKQSLEDNQVLIWGAYAGFGRLRISSHLYNNSDDIERCITALHSVV